MKWVKAARGRGFAEKAGERPLAFLTPIDNIFLKMHTYYGIKRVGQTKGERNE